MVELYITLDEDNFITSYGHAKYGIITQNKEDSILIKVDKNHEIALGSFGNWKYENGDLYKDTSRVVDNLKNAKKGELSQACQECILGGFTSKVDGVDYHFSYDREAQMNYQERWQLFQNNMIDSIVMTAHGLDGSDARLEVDKKIFDNIYLDSVKHKENCIKRLRDDLFPLVDNSQSVEDLNAISWDMEILTPTPESIVVRDDKLLNDEVERLEMESAQSGSELMGLIMMLGMGF